MQLTVDSRFSPEPVVREDVEYLTLGELVADVRDPSALARRLWGRPWHTATVVEDGLPRSFPQAAALAVVALARARRFELQGPEGSRSLGRLELAGRALAATAVALPRELWQSWRVLRRTRRFLQGDTRAAPPASGPGSVAYLRPAPTLRYLGQYVGGAAAHTTGVINGLTRNGLDVEVYAPERPEGIQTAGSTLVPLRRIFHLVHWLTVTAYSHDVVAAARPRPADFVYQRYVLGSYAGLELAQRLGVPLVLEFNGSEIWSHKNWGAGRLPLADTLEEIEERNVRDASLVVVVSEIIRDELIERGIEPERVLANPNGVDVGELAPFRLEPLLPEDRPTVGFVGTFGLWHGVTLLPDLIEAVARLAPETRWVLIGGGGLHRQVSEEIRRRGLSGNVELTGVIARDEAMARLAACHVCVSPHVPNPDGTRFFGSPTKVFEYMGLGKPIVAADLEQIGEVLEHERTALLHEPGDVEAAAAAVARLLGDPALRAALGAAALEEAERTYSWDAHVRRILDALESRVRAPALLGSP